MIKTRRLQVAVMLLVLCTAASAQKVIIYESGGKTSEYKASEIDSIAFVNKTSTHGITDGHEWVDLGLPSGTLWATCNVGADSPEGWGDYFAWGETTGYHEGKTNFRYVTYKWMQEGDWEMDGQYDESNLKFVNKYTFADGRTDCCWYDSEGNFIGDGMTELLPEDDVATVKWGANWQTPSNEQISELIDSKNTTSEWTTLNGVEGRLVKSLINGNTLFITAGGYRHGSNAVGQNNVNGIPYLGYFYSRSLHTVTTSTTEKASFYAEIIYFSKNNIYMSTGHRYRGLPVRPVRKK